MTAVLSECGTYRYRLERAWSDDPRDVWLMLNPSTADATLDDPTIRRCVGFSRRWGAGGIVVANLYALRATDPAELERHPDPVGPANDAHIADVVQHAWRDGARIVCAWGAHPFAASRALDVAEGLRDMLPVCLGTTRSGAPRHPLYVRADVVPVRWTS